MSISLQLLISTLSSLIAMHWIFTKILEIAKSKGIVDNPGSRKLQDAPVPVMGGAAVFGGLVVGLFVFAFLQSFCPNADFHELYPVLLGAVVMLCVGLLDDMKSLSPLLRMAIEILVMSGVIFGSGVCIDSFHGLWGVTSISWTLAVPLTVFAGVGLINAYNMIDGVDGLSSGLCIVSSCILAVVCAGMSDYTDCAMLLCYAASLFPFMMHNVFGRSSKMFLGDGGTMVMGLLMSWTVMRILSVESAADSLASDNSCGSAPGMVALLLAVASVPVFDTLRVMSMRILHGKNPFQADKTHLHHQFVKIGVCHFATTLYEIVINLLVIAAWFISYKLGADVDVQLYIVIATSVIFVWGMYVFLSRKSDTYKKADAAAPSNNCADTSTLWLRIQQWLDK